MEIVIAFVVGAAVGAVGGWLGYSKFGAKAQAAEVAFKK